MKKIFYHIAVISLFGIGMSFIASGVEQRTAGLLDGPVLWNFNPIMIGIGAAFVVSAVLLYDSIRIKSN